MKKYRFISITVFCIILFVVGFINIFVVKNKSSLITTKKMDRITFATWGTPKQMEILKLIANQFSETENSKVDVFCFSSIENCRTKVVSQFAAGDPFDVFFVEDGIFTTLAQKGYLMDLSSLVDKNIINSNDYYPIAFKKGIYNRKLLGLPANTNPYVIYYNKKLFERSGIESPEDYYNKQAWNTDNLYKVCKAIKTNTNAYGLAIKNDWQTFMSIINSVANTEIHFDEDGTILADEVVLKAMDTYKLMIQNKHCLYMGSMPKGVTEEELFKSQQIAMVYSDFSYNSSFNDIKDFKWDIVPFPSEGKGNSVNVLQIQTVAVANKTESPEIAKKFIQYYTGARGQRLRFEQGERAMPSLKYSVYSTVAFPDHSNYFFYTLNEGMIEPNTYNYLNNKVSLLSRMHYFWMGVKKGCECY